MKSHSLLFAALAVALVVGVTFATTALVRPTSPDLGTVVRVGASTLSPAAGITQPTPHEQTTRSGPADATSGESAPSTHRSTPMTSPMTSPATAPPPNDAAPSDTAQIGTAHTDTDIPPNTAGAQASRPLDTAHATVPTMPAGATAVTGIEPCAAGNDDAPDADEDNNDASDDASDDARDDGPDDSAQDDDVGADMDRCND